MNIKEMIAKEKIILSNFPDYYGARSARKMCMLLRVWSHENLEKEAIPVVTNRANFRGLSHTQ